MKNINTVVFSATGNTLKITELLLKEFDCTYKKIDVTNFDDHTEELFFENLTIFSFPVFVGRVPQPFIEKIKNYRGNNTPAVILATIGNRHYDDAILEMRDLLSGQGFIPIAAASFIAEHSIFPSVAYGRPDQNDLPFIQKFARIIKDKLVKDEYEIISVKGNFPYREDKASLFKPLTNDQCNLCGLCFSHCPAEAISEEEPNKTKSEKCISCMRCIKICPENARYLDSKKDILEKDFYNAYHRRKDPVIFF